MQLSPPSGSWVILIAPTETADPLQRVPPHSHPQHPAAPGSVLDGCGILSPWPLETGFPHPHGVCLGIALPGMWVYVSGVHLGVELPAPKVGLFIAGGAVRPLPQPAHPGAVCRGLCGLTVTVTLCDLTAGQWHPRVAPSTPSDFSCRDAQPPGLPEKSCLVFSPITEVITRSKELKS